MTAFLRWFFCTRRKPRYSELEVKLLAVAMARTRAGE